jgi:hypothetical protein
LGEHCVHVPLAQASEETQSLLFLQAEPVPQGEQLPPPQSTPVSTPSFMPSVHWPTHLLFWHTLPVEQSSSLVHATHLPARQSFPPESLHEVRGVAFTVLHAPCAVQTGMTQVVPVAGQLEASRHATQEPFSQKSPPLSVQPTPLGTA